MNATIIEQVVSSGRAYTYHEKEVFIPGTFRTTTRHFIRQSKPITKPTRVWSVQVGDRVKEQEHFRNRKHAEAWHHRLVTYKKAA